MKMQTTSMLRSPQIPKPEFSSLSRCPLQLHPPYPFDSAKTIGLVFWRASCRQFDFMLSHITMCNMEKPFIPGSLASWTFLMIHVWPWHTDSAALDSKLPSPCKFNFLSLLFSRNFWLVSIVSGWTFTLQTEDRRALFRFRKVEG